jgi:hypothetical protein
VSATIEIEDDDATVEAPMPFVVPAELEEIMRPEAPEVPLRDEPSLITLFRDQLEAGRKSSERLADSLDKHNADEAIRHEQLLGAVRDLGRENAVRDAAEGAVRARAVAVAESAWSIFKAPMAWAATAAMTYLVYKVLGIPPTPTPIALTQPVAVEVAPTTDPSAPALTGAAP